MEENLIYLLSQLEEENRSMKIQLRKQRELIVTLQGELKECIQMLQDKN